MKNCLICDKEIEKDKELCDACEQFFSWKYKKDFEKKLARFRKSKKYLNKWRSSKKEVEE